MEHNSTIHVLHDMPTYRYMKSLLFFAASKDERKTGREYRS